MNAVTDPRTTFIILPPKKQEKKPKTRRITAIVHGFSEIYSTMTVA
jgi:hypothetical protein